MTNKLRTVLAYLALIPTIFFAGIGLLGLAISEGDAGVIKGALFSLVFGLIMAGIFFLLKPKKQQVDAAPYAASVAPPAPTLAGVPAPAGAPVAPRPTAPKPTATTAPSSPRDKFTRIIIRSDKPLSTIKDLVAHKNEALGYRHVIEGLEASGILDVEDVPDLDIFVLSRNNRFWMRNIENGTKADYDALSGAEAALNMNLDLPDSVLDQPLDDSAAKVATQLVLCSMTKQVLTRRDRSPEFALAYGAGGDANASEWEVRRTICLQLEELSIPFRVMFDLRVNLAEGAVYLSLRTPRPDAMRGLVGNDNTVGEARAYAFRLLTCGASIALRASTKIEHVYAVCDTYVEAEHEKGSFALLSLHATRENIKEFKAYAESNTLATEPLPVDDALSYAIDEDGWFKPTPKRDHFDFDAVSPSWRTQQPELRSETFSPALQELAGCATVRDISINEDATRIVAWNDLVKRLDENETTASMVSRLVALAESSEDQTVKEASARVNARLVSGNLDVSDRPSMAHAFVHGSRLERAAAAAREETSKDEPDPLAVYTPLKDILDPLLNSGVYQDSDTTVYRYFNSTIDRVGYNRASDAAGREVRLVPDAYYTALSLASSAAQQLDNIEDAQRYAAEMVRIAANNTDATMRMVRVLEEQEKIFDAVEHLKIALSRVCTPQDTAYLFYRLAYMEWKLGREDLAVPCYQRSLEWHSRMEDAAKEELNDLASVEGVPQPLATSEEVHAAITAAGIPLGFVKSDMDALVKLAVRATDEGVFSLAHIALSIYNIYGQDSNDVLADIARSLESTLEIG